MNVELTPEARCTSAKLYTGDLQIAARIYMLSDLIHELTESGQSLAVTGLGSAPLRDDQCIGTGSGEYLLRRECESDQDYTVTETVDTDNSLTPVANLVLPTSDTIRIPTQFEVTDIVSRLNATDARVVPSISSEATKTDYLNGHKLSIISPGDYPADNIINDKEETVNLNKDREKILIPGFSHDLTIQENVIRALESAAGLSGLVCISNFVTQLQVEVVNIGFYDNLPAATDSTALQVISNHAEDSDIGDNSSQLYGKLSALAKDGVDSVKVVRQIDRHDRVRGFTVSV